MSTRPPVLQGMVEKQLCLEQGVLHLGRAGRAQGSQRWKPQRALLEEQQRGPGDPRAGKPQRAVLEEGAAKGPEGQSLQQAQPAECAELCSALSRVLWTAPHPCPAGNPPPALTQGCWSFLEHRDRHLPEGWGKGLFIKLKGSDSILN